MNNNKIQIVIALIATVTTCLTIFSSIYMMNKTTVAQAEQQRAEEVREMKRTYYNQFIDAYSRKLQFVQKQDSAEKVEAELVFMNEVDRLPLYASQEMVEFINKIKDPEEAKKAEHAEFFKIMREDLCSNEFLSFDNIGELSMSLSNSVVVTDKSGQKVIQ